MYFILKECDITNKSLERVTGLLTIWLYYRIGFNGPLSFLHGRQMNGRMSSGQTNVRLMSVVLRAGYMLPIERMKSMWTHAFCFALKSSKLSIFGDALWGSRKVHSLFGIRL